MVKKRDGRRRSGDPRRRVAQKVEVTWEPMPPELQHLRPTPQVMYCTVLQQVIWVGTPVIGMSTGPGGKLWGMKSACPSCGQTHPVLNAHHERDKNGALHVLFPATQQDVDRIGEIIALLEMHGPQMTREQIADEIEKRVPVLSALADEIRRTPLAAAGAIASVLAVAIAILGPNHGITPEQMQDLIDAVRQSPASSARELPAEFGGEEDSSHDRVGGGMGDFAREYPSGQSGESDGSMGR